ncbi:MAG: hypothetical protein Q4B54_06325 [Coriobacteriales bacterium]|nr:hypothetical protein [Coriobacteriales bacterium]
MEASQLKQNRIRVAPQWWRHGYVQPTIFEQDGGGNAYGYTMDPMLDDVPESVDFDAVYGLLVDQERTYLSKWPFLYELEPDREYRGKLDTLPVEFIAHQVRDIDVDDFDAVFDFLCKWGFPYSPLREDKLCAQNFGGLGEENLKGMWLTDKMRMCVSVYTPVISYDEVRATLLLLQETWARIERAILGDDDVEEDLFPINAAASASLVGYTSSYADDMEAANAWASTTNRLLTKESVSSQSMRYRGMLTSAIANQLLETIHDDAPWKVCKECGRVFKRKQADSLNPDKKAIYCSATCLGTIKQRNYRSRKKKGETTA